MDSESNFHISFICTGNICRSPFAAAALKHLAKDYEWSSEILISSAGELDLHEAPAHTLMIAEGGRRGFSLLQHRSQQFNDNYLESCDLILCLAAGHAAMIKKAHPQVSSKLFQLAQFPDPSLSEEHDVPDPIGKDEAFFAEGCDLIMKLIENIVLELDRRKTENNSFS